jgi:hypothetical protein
MNASKWVICLGVGAIALGGCAVVPEGPSVRVLPAPGKPFEVFVSEDQYCRSYAQSSIGNAQQAAADSAIGSAVVGTAIGATAGALLGGRSGAGAGAGLGLVMGSAVGSGEASRTGYSAQRRYDYAYQQCMYAKGNLLPGQPMPYYSAPPPPPPPPPTGSR